LARKLAVIPKSTENSRLVENLEAVNVQLTAEEVERIGGLNLNLRVWLCYLFGVNQLMDTWILVKQSR